MGNLWIISGYPLVNIQKLLNMAIGIVDLPTKPWWLSIVMLGLPEGTFVGWSSYTRVDLLVYRDCELWKERATCPVMGAQELRSCGYLYENRLVHW